MTNATPSIQRLLLARSADGEEWPVLIKVGAPMPSDIAPWSCMVEVDRLFSPAKPIYGEDSWQAMQLAQEFAAAMLEQFQARGGTLFWPREESASELQAFQARDLLPRLRA